MNHPPLVLPLLALGALCALVVGCFSSGAEPSPVVRAGTQQPELLTPATTAPRPSPAPETPVAGTRTPFPRRTPDAAGNTPTPWPTASPFPDSRPARAPIDGGPRPVRREIEAPLAPSPQPFSPWNRIDVVLYDSVLGTEENLGPGAFATFSPNGRHLAWAAAQAQDDFRELKVMDLETRTIWDAGPARHVRWIDPAHVLVALPGTNIWETVNIHDGSRMPSANRGTSELSVTEGARWLLESRRPSPSGPDLAASDRQEWQQHHRVVDRSGLLTPLEFISGPARLAPDGVLFYAAAPRESPYDANAPYGQRIGIAEVFSLDPVSGVAVAIATTEVSETFPLSASEQYVAWGAAYCAPRQHPGAHTALYHRASATITKLPERHWVQLLPGGRLGVGPFGPSAVIEISTLTYSFALPTGAVDVRWSPDFRMAALSAVFGHGGVCPP